MAYQLETAAIAGYTQLLRHRTQPPMPPHLKQHLQSTCALVSSIAPSSRATTSIAAKSTSLLHTLEGENFPEHSVTSNDLILSTGKRIQAPMLHTLFFLAVPPFPNRAASFRNRKTSNSSRAGPVTHLSTFSRPPDQGL